MELESSASILIYGCGKMGEAILSGWLTFDESPVGALSPKNFHVVERTSERIAEIARDYGVDATGDITNVPAVDMVLLAIKPQSFGEALPIIRNAELVDSEGNPPLYISIAAGIETSDIEGVLGDGARVVRVMPNLPLQVGAGASAVCGGKYVTSVDVELVCEMFAALGVASIVDEDKINAVCAISGGGPAYFAYMVELMAQAGENAGLDASVAEQLALNTLYGTGLVLHESNQSAVDLRVAVCSPGGTTLAALSAMDSHGIKEAVQAGIDGAIARAEELSKC